MGLGMTPGRLAPSPGGVKMGCDAETKRQKHFLQKPVVFLVSSCSSVDQLGRHVNKNWRCYFALSSFADLARQGSCCHGPQCMKSLSSGLQALQGRRKASVGSSLRGWWHPLCLLPLQCHPPQAVFMHRELPVLPSWLAVACRALLLLLLGKKDLGAGQG